MANLTARIHQLASPARFARLSRIVLPFAAVLAALCLGIGFYQALVTSPPDYQQGEAVRIMYIHVPSAWMATMAYAGLAILSITYLIWKHPLADVMARELAPIGAVFTVITLVTGSLWGKPMWGAYWVWDARLTSVAILLFLYLGYIVASASLEPSDASRTGLAWLAIVGAINLPIIKFSVEWFETLHQPASLLRKGGPSIDPSMLYPLLWCLGGFLLLTLVLLLVRVEAALNEQKTLRLQRQMMRERSRRTV